jgi:predicted nucleic acid-binding protein
MIFLDTSALVGALTGSRAFAPLLREALERGERARLPTIVLYEWLRGPRLAHELAAQEALFPSTTAIPFGPAEAAKAAELYRRVTRGARGRDADIAIAACAICHDATLWTLNIKDFADLPGLRLKDPR